MGRLLSPPANFAVVDYSLWRGARPTPDQAQWLVSQGIKSVVNLELFEEDKEAFGPLLDQLQYRHLEDWEPLPLFVPEIEDAHIHAFLEALPLLPKPVYVHCRDGQNRTGVAVAAYCLVKGDRLCDVIAVMRSFGGFWRGADTHYIMDLAPRIKDFK